MKIKKQLITESNLTKEIEQLEEAADETEVSMEEIPEEEMIVDDVLGASTAEVADAIQAAAEEASDGKETYSDKNAESIAKELKTYAQGFDAAAWAPLDVPSELTDKLDDCLANALVAQASGTHDGVDLLVCGLPGSGKTGITKQWADDRGVNLFYLNAKNDDLGAILNGFPVDTAGEDEEGNKVHKVIRSYSNALDPLKRPRSVLFLDEFNRAAPKLRATLLTLINEHEVEGPGEKGTYRFENLLFTVACINPSVPTDPGAMDLNDAEMSRFVDKLDWDSKVDDAIRYLEFHIKKVLARHDPSEENYAFFYVRYNKIINLARALLTDYRFEFDSRDDLLDLFNDKATMLNQRAITDALMSHGYAKQKFLNWVDKYSKFLQKDKDMIHEILDTWVEPEVKAPTSGSANTEEEPENAPAKQAAATDETDFDSVFGSEGEESDTDLFGSTASKAGNAAKVSAADALARIKGFDFSL
jgi:MoxR-like ATPase